MSDNGSSYWTDEDDAMVSYEALPGWHPALFVDVFRLGVTEAVDIAILRGAFVTPESVSYWDDFAKARRVFATGLKISMTPLYAKDAPDVCYVRLVETDQHTNSDLTQVPATLHITLVWRPEIAVVPNSSWRIHHLGDPVEPGSVPRTATDVDPRTSS